MSIRFYVLAKRAGICVTLVASWETAVVWLGRLMRAYVLETVAGVGVGFFTPFHRTYVRSFTCWKKSIIKNLSAEEILNSPFLVDVWKCHRQLEQ
jgi:hypothetical protein